MIEAPLQAVPVEPVFYEAPLERAVEEPVELVEPEGEHAPSPLPSAEIRTAHAFLRRERRVRTWQLGAVTLVALLIGILVGRIGHSSGRQASALRSTGAAAAGQSGPAAAGQPAAGAQQPSTPAGSPTTVAAPAASANAAPGHTVLLDIRRQTGPMITQHFVVTAKRWILGWAYDCTGQGGTGAFNITVFDGSGGPSKDGGIDQQGAKGSSVVAYSSTGERYLSVTTNCVWAVRVTS